MKVGRYNGKRVGTLPMSYLRWVIGQDFSPDILEAAKKKLEASDYNDLFLNISRHAIDMFSKRFLHLWAQQAIEMGDNKVGIATFITQLAQTAWEKGEDVSLHRHQDDGVVKQFEGIKWVFHVNPHYPDYREVITIMDSKEWV